MLIITVAVTIKEEFQQQFILHMQHLATEHMQAHFAKVTPWVDAIEMKSFEASEVTGLMG